MNSIFPFTSSEIHSLEQAGGKALALIQMTHAGMPVPPGFVLTVEFFEPWMDSLKRSSEWTALTKADNSRIGQTAKALQELCRNLHFTKQQKEELTTALNEFREKDHAGLLAVRSSSPEEDLEGASFAGGYETTLGVTIYKIDQAILHSFTSSFDERVFLYKKEHGFRIDQPRIAVVVQQQVDAESAGVAFSLNPLNNCYDEAVINANHGLGESVVSGDADPDVFVVDKIKHEIIETRIGSKATVITLDQQGGTTKSIHTDHQEASITTSQAMEIAGLLEKVEEYYQKPVDIEWAISEGKLYLLQARPITTYLPLPEEMITPPGSPKKLYANSTLIEQGMQDPLSVLGTDFLRYILNQVGGPVARGAIGTDGAAFCAGGGYYINISYTLKMGMGEAALSPGSFGDPRVMAILDNMDKKQYLSVELPKKLKSIRIKMILTMPPLLVSVLSAYLKPQVILNRYRAAIPVLNEKFVSVPTGTSLHDYASELTVLLGFFYDEYGIPLIAASQIAQQGLRSLFAKHDREVQDLLVNLGISLPGNKTTEMGELMYALASNTGLDRINSADDLLVALEQGSLPPDLASNWEHYMNEFGMRCPGEVDPATPRPREDVRQLFDQLKTMSETIKNRPASHPFFEEARLRRETTYNLLYKKLEKQGKKKARVFQKRYNTYLLVGGFRETPKHYVIKVIDLFRRHVLGIAQMFVDNGRLDNREQIFDLTIADIDQALSDQALDLRARGETRSALIKKIKRSHLVVRIIDSRGRVFYPPRQAARDGELSGVPISPGTVKGRVKVLHTPYENKLEAGDILVARATDPGWTPLFINAGGIVLEIGGALQHGAVVAREYGIPCVSGLDDATSLLTDGQLVEVDGSNGIVRILE
jgi:phosphoenolpyruvate synthase/pyruvate phosphate dikinase